MCVARTLVWGTAVRCRHRVDRTASCLSTLPCRNRRRRPIRNATRHQSTMIQASYHSHFYTFCRFFYTFCLFLSDHFKLAQAVKYAYFFPKFLLPPICWQIPIFPFLWLFRFAFLQRILNFLCAARVFCRESAFRAPCHDLFNTF